MQKVVILLGTQHPLQEASPRLSNAVLDDFRTHILKLCQTHQARSIAEEMSLQVVHEWRRPPRNSIPHDVAQELGIFHQYSDPNQVERDALGIQSVETDLARRIALGLPKTPQAELLKREQEEFIKREEEWFRRISGLDRWPMLFVCGINHVPTFSAKLQACGFSVHSLPYYLIPR